MSKAKDTAGTVGAAVGIAYLVRVGMRGWIYFNDPETKSNIKESLKRYENYVRENPFRVTLAE